MTNIASGSALNSSLVSSSPSTLSGDDSEKSHAIPTSLIREQWQLILDQDATIPDLINAIERCRELVLSCDQCSDERKWLVRHLVELRYRLRELQDVAEDPDAHKPGTKVILGHHFIPRLLKNLPKHKIFCDHCSGVIWSVVQASYVCIDCSFSVHHKCLQNVLRVCAHVLVSERQKPIERICPEIGLALQFYKCSECSTKLDFKETTNIEARLCDYSGLYYCPTCHWNNTSVIPARIVHNWDFVPRKLGRASLQEVELLYEAPVINLEEKNPRLFNFVENLSLVKKLREDLHHMKQYLSICRVAVDEKLLEVNIGQKRYLVQTPQMYSIADLVAVENGTLVESLNKIRDIFENHIRKCVICIGKGYICEICSNEEPIFPFEDCSVPCVKCNSVYHRACWFRKNMKCEKCWRMEKRKKGQDIENDN